jgi:uncharacterized protein YxjI/Zn-finger nucleic acid-binding protein
MDPRCPRHKEKLKQTELPFGALTCLACDGHFIPEGEGTRLIEGVAGITLDQLEVLFATRAGHETLSCPGCQHVMPSVELRGTWPNCCRACGALWFDADELKRFIAAPDPEEARQRARLEALKREVSGPGPRPQLNASDQTDPAEQLALARRGPQAAAKSVPSYIGCADQFTIEQETELVEALFDVETENRYTIKTPLGKGRAIETSASIWTWVFRALWGAGRPLQIEITDTRGRKALRLDRPLFFLFSTMTVESADGVPLGSVKRRFALLYTRYVLVDAHGEVFARTFPLTDTKGRRIGEVKKTWGGLLKEMFTDADRFGIDVRGADLTPDQRAVVLAAGLSIDLDFFEASPRRD